MPVDVLAAVVLVVAPAKAAAGAGFRIGERCACVPAVDVAVAGESDIDVDVDVADVVLLATGVSIVDVPSALHVCAKPSTVAIAYVWLPTG